MNRLALTAALFLVTVSTAQAQWYGGGYGYSPYGVGPYAGPGGVIAGQAALVDSVGQLNINNEKARVERQKAEQAKLDTQKQAFDQMLYERSLKPTWAADLKIDNQRVVSRYMTNPEAGEIMQGKTFNAFAPYISSLAQQGVVGPPVPINQMALKKINVTTGPTGPRIGLLREPLRWPMGLRGPLQQKVDPLIRSAVSSATTGDLQPDLYKQINGLVRQINDDFLERFRKEEVSTSEYLAAVPYMDALKSAIQGLADPNAQSLLDGTLSAKGNNVPELVSNMSALGLTFAPGNPGSDAAYRGLQDAMVGYIRSTQAASGIQLQLNPTNPLAKR